MPSEQPSTEALTEDEVRKKITEMHGMTRECWIAGKISFDKIDFWMHEFTSQGRMVMATRIEEGNRSGRHRFTAVPGCWASIIIEKFPPEVVKGPWLTPPDDHTEEEYRDGKFGVVFEMKLMNGVESLRNYVRHEKATEAGGYVFVQCTLPQSS